MISNFEMFRGIEKKEQILKVTALYLMWNPDICQDDLFLLRREKNVLKSNHSGNSSAQGYVFS